MKNQFLPGFKKLVILTKEFIYLLILLILFFAVMNIWGHGGQPQLWAGALVLFSLAKISFLVSHTFKKLDTLLEDDHSYRHMLFLLGAIISIIVLSFTMDYLCIAEIYPHAFSNIHNGQPLVIRFTNLLYFSIATFTTVGYGDIVPLVPVAKLFTVFEMMSAFVVMVFIISRYFKK